MEASTSHLEIEDLRVGFQTFDGFVPALDIHRLSVGRGDSVGLVGESGSGKSVLALSMLRLLHCPPAKVSAKRFEFDGTDLLSQSDARMREIRGREIAMIFQDPMSSLNPVFTVGAQLNNVLRRVGGVPKHAVHEHSLRMVSLVGLPDPENMLAKYPHQLSGGQRQRVIIALALACGAKFLIADEPTRNLDVTVQAGILQTIAGLRSELGVSILFIANNLGLVSAMCSHVSVLLGGRVVESGTVDEVVDDPRHPYTHMLLRAIPTAEAQSTGTEVAAAPAATSGLPVGCAYYRRCSSSADVCAREELPPDVLVGASHSVACWREMREEAPA